MKKQLLIGAHMSIAGGVHNALEEAGNFGANIIQIFTANQRQWNSKPIADEEIALWKQLKRETGISHIMSHDSYLINLGSPKQEMLEKGLQAFEKELQRCHKLEIDYLNFHPGSAVGSTEELCLETIVKSLKSLIPAIEKGKTLLLIESTAGQGTNVGYKFEHLGYLVDQLKDLMPIGICIDTCHTFAAGYDITSQKGWDATLKEFDDKIGLKYLKAFHVNDSKHEIGSRKDRHENLGKGKIGLKCFEVMMSHPKLKYLPKYLETPNGDTYWKEEIKLLKKLGEKDAH